MTDLRLWLSRNYGPLIALGLFVFMFAIYVGRNDAGLTVNLATTAANKGVLLAFVAMAQTLVVITAGIDLSVGMIYVLSNCIASALVQGDSWHVALGVLAVLASGLICGAINGAIIVYGRLQPIIATLATGAIFFGVALSIRPVPGGAFDENFGDAMTGQVFGVIPTSLVVLFVTVLVIWYPFRNSVIGRGCYAVGSAPSAAYMSGVDINRSKFAAYMLCGLLAAMGGIFLGCVTDSGEANAASGGGYTLNSIATVVIGGTSLFGGAGGAIGSIFGAFALRTIGDLLFVFDMPPLWQSLFQGVVLLVAVSMGAARVFRIKNRLDLFG